VANNLKFNNAILMLNEEDRGFGRDKTPAGYVRLEVRDGKGKITVMVQSLKDSDEYNIYKLYLIRYHEGEIYPAFMCKIPVKNGRGQITREFNPFNVEDTKLHVDDFNIGVVILERKSIGRTDIKYPLVSYKGERVKWTEAFENYLEASRTERKVKYGEKIKEKSKEILGKKDEELKREVKVKSEEKVEAELEEKVVEIKDSKEINSLEEETRENRISKNVEEVIKKDAEEDIGEKTEIEIDSSKMALDMCDDIYSKYTGRIESKYSFTENIPEKNPDEMCTNCIEQYKSIMDEGINKEYENKEIKEQKKEETLPDIDLLVNCLDKVFKRCDPFNTRRRDYKWWKIHSPVYLSNVLQYCNINIPKIFNPSIIMAYYKYRYLIAGIYTSRKKGKEYIVYGIPGTYNIDDSPLGDLCRWIQIEGNIPKYGAFGYWIVYIDPATGKLLRVG
jgi:hypothetical protein